jgi:hypothetical protein
MNLETNLNKLHEQEKQELIKHYEDLINNLED